MDPPGLIEFIVIFHAYNYETFYYACTYHGMYRVYVITISIDKI